MNKGNRKLMEQDIDASLSQVCKDNYKQGPNMIL